MKVCFKPRKTLTLLYTSFEKRHSFLYLPLKNCTLFEYLLYKNKSVKQEVFRLSVIFVQLLTEFNDIPLRRVSSKPFNKRPFKILDERLSPPSYTSTYDFPTL